MLKMKRLPSFIWGRMNEKNKDSRCARGFVIQAISGDYKIPGSVLIFYRRTAEERMMRGRLEERNVEKIPAHFCGLTMTSNGPTIASSHFSFQLGLAFISSAMQNFTFDFEK